METHTSISHGEQIKNSQKLKLALITEGHVQTDKEFLNVFHGQHRFSI